MPFKSKAQWRACFAADDPNWDCREWADSTPSYKELPKKKKKEKKADDSSDLTPKRVRVAMPHEDGYLMEKLKNPKFPANIGRIRFPGGGIDEGETPETAAVRELKEELGIDINSEDLARLGVYPDGVKGPEQYFQLDKHTLTPGNYKATVGGDEDIELITGKTDDKNYWGGQLDALKQAASAAWQRSEGKNSKGGLNEKGRKSYERENPGSDLKAPVTGKVKPGGKAAKRRKSFCARMKGNKGPMKKPNGEPTRKALSLRKWKCGSDSIKQATAPGTEDITQGAISVKSASTMLGHFLVEPFNQRVTGTESVFFKENAHMPMSAPATEAGGLPGFDTTERDKLKAQAQSFVPKKQPMIPQNAVASAPASNVSPSEVAPGFGLGRYAGGTPALGHSLNNSQLGNGAGVQMPKVAAAITGLLSSSLRI